MLLLNGRKVDTGQFPNKETWVNKRLLNVSQNSRIIFEWESNDDLINLMFLKRHLDRFGISTTLIITYMPYSRMDRENDDYLYSLKYVTRFINDLNFNQVKLLNPHSNISAAMLHNCTVKHTVVDKAEEILPEYDYLLLPDSGARQRYVKLTTDKPIITASKERDFKTGEIVKFEIDKIPEAGSKILIIDDLCCKGGTFMATAALVPNCEVHLLVGNVEEIYHEGQIPASSIITKVFTPTETIK